MNMLADDLQRDAIPHAWVRKELMSDEPVGQGAPRPRTRIIQEWLSLHGLGLQVDGLFGPATERAVRQFQRDNDLSETGVVDEVTFQVLIAPLLRALQPIDAAGLSYEALVVRYAEQHLAEHPREIGGANMGPWVRLYMRGHQGHQWLWCAGFVSFLLQQAADTLGRSMPIPYLFSCDLVATEARQRGLFVPERDLDRDRLPPAGSLFLVRRTATDWTHVGLVTRFDADVIETIEGNTNDEGSREGHEACRRFRSYKKKDFILIR